VRSWLAFFVAGWRRYSAYRAATLAGAVTNTVFGVVKASITVAAVGSAGGAIAGYDARAASTYSWLVQGLIATVALFGWDELAQRVRSGDVAVDLARPVDLQGSMLAADLGRGAYLLVPRAALPLTVGALFYGLRLPGDPLAYLLGALSVVAAVTISFACRFAVNLVAFWVVELRGVQTLYLVATNVLSGLIVPVAWFPGWLGALAAVTPFPSMLQAPVDILSGRVSGWDAARTLAVQLVWVAVTLALGRVVLARAGRKLVVQGG
jgi:ABC-2 type transport system permease protein